jgi:chromosome segregation ATPase
VILEFLLCVLVLSQCLAAADQLKSSADSERKSHKELEGKLSADQNTLATRDRTIQDLKNQLESVRKSAAAELKNSHIVENQMEQLRNRRHALFRNCMRDEIALPITGGEFPDGMIVTFVYFNSPISLSVLTF